MCAEVNQNDLTTIHHEMGHIEYFLAYKNQPNTFRAGANPGFHEAIGDTISLSVETPTYLKKVNLLKKEKWNKGEIILRSLLFSLFLLSFTFFIWFRKFSSTLS